MASLLPLSRSLSHQFASRASQLAAIRHSCANSWSRVRFNNNNTVSLLGDLLPNNSTPLLGQLLRRSYATRRGRPKAHTGRASASKRKAAVAQSDGQAAVPEKAPEGSRTTKKPAAEKPGRKPRSKTERRAKSKRGGLTEKQKAANVKKAAGQKLKDLKQRALLHPPKQLPATAFTVLVTESSSKGTASAPRAKMLAAQYRSLGPEEMERLNHIATQNKVKNDTAYKRWLSGYTPAEVKAANAARDLLSKQQRQQGRKNKLRHIQDERIVKLARRPYIFFLMDRFASGDMKHMKVTEVAALVGREWKALSAAEKKPFEDRAAADTARYIEEYTTVNGTPPEFAKKKAT